MHRVYRHMIYGVLLMMALVLPGPLGAAEAPAATDSSNPSHAMEQLLRMGNFLGQLKQFSVTLRAGYDVVQESGQKIEFNENRSITIVRPDRLRVDVERSDAEKSSIVFDGKAVTVLSPKRNMYATADIPGDIDGAVAYFLKDLRMRLPMAMLFVSRLPQELELRILAADIVETTPLMSPPCVHIAARGQNVDFQVWIPAEGDPLPRRVVLTYKNEKGQPQYWADFSDWNLSPSISDSTFALDIPKEANRIEFLSQVPKPVKPAEKKGGKK